MITDIKAKTVQVTPVVTGEGDMDYAKMTKLGALFTADWRQQLILAGRVWSAKVGGVTASADILPVVGGGVGTTIDIDQPELVIGVPAGYYMICVEAMCAVYNIPQSAGITNIVLFADRTATCADTGVSSTITVPVNLLDGGPTFPGTCFTAGSANIAATPVCDELLDYETMDTAGIAASGQSTMSLKMDYKPEAPSILKGPCQVVLCFGGIQATSGMGVVKVAVVPESYFPVS